MRKIILLVFLCLNAVGIKLLVKTAYALGNYNPPFPRIAWQFGSALPAGDVFKVTYNSNPKKAAAYMSFYDAIQTVPEATANVVDFKSRYPNIPVFSFANYSQVVARRAMPVSDAYPGWWLMGPSTTTTAVVPEVAKRMSPPWGPGLAVTNCQQTTQGVKCTPLAESAPFVTTISVADASVFAFNCFEPQPRLGFMAYDCTRPLFVMFYDFDKVTDYSKVEQAQLLSVDVANNTITVLRNVWHVVASWDGGSFGSSAHAAGVRVGLHLNSYSCGNDCLVYNTSKNGPRDSKGERFIDAYPRYIFEKLIPTTSKFDGVDLDILDSLDYDFLGVDENLDGVMESGEAVRENQKSGVIEYTENIKRIAQARNMPIVLDGTIMGSDLRGVQKTWLAVDKSLANGVEFEVFGVDNWSGSGPGQVTSPGWLRDLEYLKRTDSKSLSPKFNFVVGKGTYPNSVKRLLLGTAMLFNGYFSLMPTDDTTEWNKVNLGTFSRLWMDEFAVGGSGTAILPPEASEANFDGKINTMVGARNYLGEPLGPATAVNGTGTHWVRYFQKGAVLINGGNTPHTFKMNENYKRIKGVLDSSINNGESGKDFVVPGLDGLVLLSVQMGIMPVPPSVPVSCSDAVAPVPPIVDCSYSRQTDKITFSWRWNGDRGDCKGAGYCKSDGTMEGGGGCDNGRFPPFWWQITNLMSKKAEYFSYDNNNRMGVDRGLSSIENNKFELDCNGKAGQYYRIDVQTRDALGNMTTDYTGVRSVTCACEKEVVPLAPTPTPTPVVAVCAGANVSSTEVFSGDKITYSIGTGSLGWTKRVKFVYGDKVGGGEVCVENNGKCEVTADITKVTKPGDKLWFWTNLVKNFDGKDQFCRAFEPKWDPAMPTTWNQDSSCNNSCVKSVEVVDMVKIAGDADNDGKVELDDLKAWKTEYLNKVGLTADFNGDKKIDLLDLKEWKTGYLKQ